VAGWFKLVFIVLAGFATSSGVALIYFSISIPSWRPEGAGLTVAMIAVWGPTLMCAVTFALLGSAMSCVVSDGATRLRTDMKGKLLLLGAHSRPLKYSHVDAFL
jgi:hypothetical protein